MTEHLPAGFAARLVDRPAEGSLDGETWLAELPRRLREALEQWDLTVTGPPWWGADAVVLPVAGADEPAVLKLAFPSWHTDTEHLALRLWAGHGAVRLLRADPGRGALLLERLDPASTAADLPVEEACRAVGEVLAQLAVPATPALRRLSDHAALLAEEVAAAGAAMPRRYVEQAHGLLSELTRARDLDATVLHTGLHDGSLLRGARRPWLAVGPKPLAGEQAFEVAPMLWRRSAELGSGPAVRRALRDRVRWVCQGAGLDEERARAWAIVRTVARAARVSPARAGGDASARDELSVLVAICKAMND